MSIFQSKLSTFIASNLLMYVSVCIPFSMDGKEEFSMDRYECECNERFEAKF